MARRQSRIALLLLIGSLMVILSGCVKFRLHLTVNRDGTAGMEITAAAHPSLANMGMLLGGDVLAEVRAGLLAEGFSVEEYTDGDLKGFKARKVLESLDDARFFASGAPGDTFMHDHLVMEKGFFYSTYHVAVPVNLTESYEGMGAVLSLLSPDLGFALTLPVRPLDHNADTVSGDGRTLEWKLHVDRENHIKVSFRVPNAAPFLLIPALALLAVSVCLYRYRFKRKKSPLADPP